MNSRIAVRLPLASLLLIATLAATPLAAEPTDSSPIDGVIQRITRIIRHAMHFVAHPTEDPVIPKP